MNKTKRHEDEEQIRAQIMADLNRAIELDPSIAEALRDLKSPSDLGYEGLRIRSASPTFSWDEFLANPPKPIEIKEPWRLKCLRE